MSSTYSADAFLVNAGDQQLSQSNQVTNVNLNGQLQPFGDPEKSQNVTEAEGFADFSDIIEDPADRALYDALRREISLDLFADEDDEVGVAPGLKPNTFDDKSSSVNSSQSASEGSNEFSQSSTLNGVPEQGQLTVDANSSAGTSNGNLVDQFTCPTDPNDDLNSFFEGLNDENGNLIFDFPNPVTYSVAATNGQVNSETDRNCDLNSLFEDPFDEQTALPNTPYDQPLAVSTFGNNGTEIHSDYCAKISSDRSQSARPNGLQIQIRNTASGTLTLPQAPVDQLKSSPVSFGSVSPSSGPPIALQALAGGVVCKAGNPIRAAQRAGLPTPPRSAGGLESKFGNQSTSPYPQVYNSPNEDKSPYGPVTSNPGAPAAKAQGRKRSAPANDQDMDTRTQVPANKRVRRPASKKSTQSAKREQQNVQYSPFAPQTYESFGSQTANQAYNFNTQMNSQYQTMQQPMSAVAGQASQKMTSQKSTVSAAQAFHQADYASPSVQEGFDRQAVSEIPSNFLSKGTYFKQSPRDQQTNQQIVAPEPLSMRDQPLHRAPIRRMTKAGISGYPPYVKAHDDVIPNQPQAMIQQRAQQQVHFLQQQLLLAQQQLALAQQQQQVMMNTAQATPQYMGQNFQQQTRQTRQPQMMTNESREPQHFAGQTPHQRPVQATPQQSYHQGSQLRQFDNNLPQQYHQAGRQPSGLGLQLPNGHAPQQPSGQQPLQPQVLSYEQLAHYGESLTTEQIQYQQKKSSIDWAAVQARINQKGLRLEVNQPNDVPQ